MAPHSRTAPSTRTSVDTPRAGQVALKFFFRLAELWGLTPEQQMVLLGGIGRSTYFNYRKLPEVRLGRDLLERISHLMGIHKSLRILFGDSPSTYDWIKRPNKAAPFNGDSALQRMLAGSLVDLSDVNRYLAAQRG
ncbi:antitoxin Xre-like helix-turn-helix domain-containing protein [Azotobacter vinelandii]|uniref:MbcA/ParS/Xre antitoxin family protein n=1 Tax=Azotobacter TaxID=352 RepID=UPI0000388B76|nr:MbcA/ParS/Xre antitoxin family protein [Azotobacter vinelandii]GLK60089.1 hypothetical protein GCM10017624_22480 [Azotobacter vinelandii]SFX32255.1 Protein of unknown function [Azotobacter vinelandii]